MTPRADADNPLERHAFSSRDEDEVTDFIRQTYVDNRLRFGASPAHASFDATTSATPQLAADHVRSTIDYFGRVEPFDYFLTMAVNGGHMHLHSTAADTHLQRGDVSFYPLGVPINFALLDLNATVIRLPLSRLRDKADELGAEPGTPLAFHDVTPTSTATGRYWLALIRLAASALHQPNSPLRSALLADNLADTLATAALHTFPNTTMTRSRQPRPGNVEPAALRRAIAHIDAHADQPLTLTDIAAAAGTSARAIQYAFTRHRGTTPTAYLRRVRLEHAHRALQAGDPTRGDTVAAIATTWGFHSPGRFAAYYHDVYGIHPYDTLRS